MTLRPYQQQALDRSRQAYRDGFKRVLLVAPTGSGKTVIAAAAIAAATAKGRRVLVVAPRREIVAQTSARLAAHGIIAAGQRNPDPTALVQLGMAQTIRRRLDTITAPDLIIVDEAHLDEWTDLLAAFPSAHYLLLTATPLRSSNRSWRGAADTLVEVETVAGLVAAGHLVEPQVWSAETPDLTGIRRAASGELSPKQAGAAFTVSAILGDTVEQIRRHCQGLRTLVFASSVKHSQALAASLPRAAHIDGTTPGPERARILAALAAGDIDTVCNYGVLCEGLDVPSVGAVVVARATQSEALWRQMVGRGLRPYAGKRACVVIDQGGNAYRHGHPMAGRVWTLDGIDRRDGEPVASCRTCAGCLAIYEPVGNECPRCGAVALPKPRPTPRVLSKAELALLRPDGTPAPTAVTPQGKRQAPRPLPKGAGEVWRVAWEQIELTRIARGWHWRSSLHSLRRAGAEVVL